MSPARALVLCAAAAVLALSALTTATAAAAQVPSGFQDSVAFDGLQEPTAFRFAPDGRVFVAEKRGKIVVFDGLDDQTPTEFANIADKVYDAYDHGLLGIALDPDFPEQPYLYALYTYDHVLHEVFPGEFPTPAWDDPPTHDGDSECAGHGFVDSCPVSGRLVRFTVEEDDTAEGGVQTPVEDLLIEDWCQQGSSHSIGDLEFGPEGALYASSGEGSVPGQPDYGQGDWPHPNMCGDPPKALGEALVTPDAEGGSLRAQDLLTPGDPTGLSGTVIRIDPDTGLALSGNPLYASGPDENARRIVGFGFRNPFRFAIHPATGELYVNNVGGGPYEEVDRLSAIPGTAYNSGWPCYEGDYPNEPIENLELTRCKALYASPGSTSAPFFVYNHHYGVTPDDQCPTERGSAISGSAFYEGGAFPASYEDAFFFSDSVRGCIYVMFRGGDGRPDPTTVVPFLTGGVENEYPGVDIQTGPGGDLYYASLGDGQGGPGTIHRIAYFSGNQPPVARLTVSKDWGEYPDGSLGLESQYDAGGSTDADGEALTYAWDLDEDGAFDDGTGVTQTTTFHDEDNHRIAVRVRDGQEASSVARVTVYPGDRPPVPEISEPQPSLLWKVGQAIHFAGTAQDPDELSGTLPATSLDWSWRLFHCPSTGCHAHPLRAFPSVGSGTLIAPDHEYPSHLELILTATDDRGLSASTSVAVDPVAVTLSIESQPAGVPLTAGFESDGAPFLFTAIEGSAVTLSAPQAYQTDGRLYDFRGWSDGGDRVHTVVADPAHPSFKAIYDRRTGEAAPPGGGPGIGIGPPVPIPETQLLDHPRRRTTARRARFSFFSENGVEFRCRLDDDPYRSCRSPRTYRHLATGGHVFRVFALNAAGSGELTPVVFRWKVRRR